MTEIKSLGYVRVIATDMDRWRELGYDVLGFAPGFGDELDALHFRMDERPSRITVERGDVDRVTAVGWEVRDEPALRRLTATLDAAGYEYTPMTQELADRRKIEGGISLADPGGTPLEIFFGPALDHSPIITKYGQKFVTGQQGLGHVVMPTTNFDESYHFYTETLGFLARGAFRMPTPPGAEPLRIRFLGVNQRHHSLAIMPSLEGRDPGLIHVMVEVDSLDAVGRALDQVEARSFPVSSTLGRHTNDKMISFYVRVPGGWDIEYGTEGKLVDESYYTAEEITADSYWGHEWAWAKAMKAQQESSPADGVHAVSELDSAERIDAAH
ncbi:VOC family protein [Rhodococcus qingshengii]|uniref:VOC family protein n=1 Tax=Rhodococcus qingshengii TaxID=334542 RepID=UPI001BEC974F|nr:VOC family protein [Rhodococcus qingshengii]MBT2272025.1 VOC family protein [Rhodococcus qingshengii]